MLRDLLRRIVDGSHFADSVQGLTGFASLPGVSAANFTVDENASDASDTKMTKLVLPLAHEFTGVRLAGAVLRTELTLGYLKAEQHIDDLLASTALASDVDSDIEVLSAVAGLGLAFDLGARSRLRPLALAGYSRIEQDGTFSGPGAARLEDAADGILFNFTTNEALYGAAVELGHERGVGHDVEFTGSIRYNHLVVDTFAASDDVLETSGSFGVLTAYTQLDGPTGATALGRELRWIGYIANSSFPGSSSDALGFDYFFEFGGGVEMVDRAVLAGVEGLSLRGSALVGNGVTGWSVAAKLEF